VGTGGMTTKADGARIANSGIRVRWPMGRDPDGARRPLSPAKSLGTVFQPQHQHPDRSQRAWLAHCPLVKGACALMPGALSAPCCARAASLLRWAIAAR